MELHITTHTFKRDGEWETIDSIWNSPFFYWKKSGLRVTPATELRIKVLGSIVAESDEGWINIGGVSAMFLQSIQSRGTKGQTIRVDVGEEISEE